MKKRFVSIVLLVLVFLTLVACAAPTPAPSVPAKPAATMLPTNSPAQNATAMSKVEATMKAGQALTPAGASGQPSTAQPPTTKTPTPAPVPSQSFYKNAGDLFTVDGVQCWVDRDGVGRCYSGKNADWVASKFSVVKEGDRFKITLK